MGFLDIMKKAVGIEEVEYEEDEYDEELVQSNDMTKLIPAEERIESRPFSKASESSSGPAVPLGSNTAKFTSQWKMLVIEPRDFNDCPKLVDSLKAKKPVIINLENLETAAARKIFDFLSGATYALNGNVQKIANNIFVFAPENVNVDYNYNQKPAEPQYKSVWK